MFSLYTGVLAFLFVYFSFFLNSFFSFFEDFFLTIAFLVFITLVFNLLKNMSHTYFAERAEHIRILYKKLFLRRKEAIIKNMITLNTLYLQNDNKFIQQYAALLYLKTQLLIKINKEQAIIIDNTAAQNLFIDLQKELTQELRTKVD